MREVSTRSFVPRWLSGTATVGATSDGCDDGTHTTFCATRNPRGSLCSLPDLLDDMDVGSWNRSGLFSVSAVSGSPHIRPEDIAYANTDRELWREGDSESGMSYYEPSIHVTEQGGIGINVGGTVYVRTLREWHALAGGRRAEWELHPEKFRCYLVGSPATRFAVTKAKDSSWRFPWQRPLGGWRLGRLIVWWSK